MVSYNKVLILGAGFIGKNLINALIKQKYSVYVIDPQKCPVEFASLVSWHVGYINNTELVNRILEVGINFVFHLTSATVPGDGMKSVLNSMRLELQDLINVVELCAKHNVIRFVFASSSSVYGRQNTFPISEAAPTNPISAHGILKLTMEKYLFFLKHLLDIDIVCFRISNPYGPGQNINGRQGFVAILIGNIINDTPVLLRNEGSTIRDYIFIDDLTRALLSTLSKGDIPWIINLGSGKRYSLREIVSISEKILGRSIQFKIEVNQILEDIPESVLDIDLASRVLNFKPQTEIEKGLYETFRFHKLV